MEVSEGEDMKKVHPKSFPFVGSLASGIEGERPLHQQERGPRHGNNRKWKARMKWKTRKRNRQMVKNDERKLGTNVKLDKTCGQ
jgi:hypothetical protein